MRKSLYVKDDDYRLSFLYGNFTTLTRFTEADLERVDHRGARPALREHPRHRPRAADPAAAQPPRRHEPAVAAALLDAGVEVHGQVVVCPGVNDGAALDDTLLGVLDRFPELATVGVVPLGVSDHNTEPDMRPHTPGEAEAVIDVVAAWQERFLDALGRRLVFAADEYYLMAGRPFPELDEYEGFRSTRTASAWPAPSTPRWRPRSPAPSASTPTGTRGGFFAWVDGAPAEGYRAPRAGAVGRRRRTADATRPAPVTIAHRGVRRPGARAAAAGLAERAGGRCALLPVANRFFGGNIARHRAADRRRRRRRARRPSPPASATCCPTSSCRRAGSSTAPPSPTCPGRSRSSPPTASRSWRRCDRERRAVERADTGVPRRRGRRPAQRRASRRS